MNFNHQHCSLPVHKITTLVGAAALSSQELSSVGDEI